MGPLDLLRELRKLKPTVVHFSGHGGQGVASDHGPGPPRRAIHSEIGRHQSTAMTSEAQPNSTELTWYRVHRAATIDDYEPRAGGILEPTVRALHAVATDAD